MKPWLALPPSLAHSLSGVALPLISSVFQEPTPIWSSCSWKHLHFNNPLGIAGGVDKEGSQVLHWQKLGAGFVEVGTLTPQPQGPNSGKILDRDNASSAVWNKMGFPNLGASHARDHLAKIKTQIKVPLFINIGKNRHTPNEEAAQDYKECAKTLSGLADIFVINVSSPNTKGLRDLQSEEQLAKLLGEVKSQAPHTPLLLKLSPDMTTDTLEQILISACKHHVDGFILTNTTLSRGPSSPFSQEGGVSGLPLKTLSEKALKTAIRTLGKDTDKLIVSAGGIMSLADIKLRMDIGAHLFQVYAALIFEGPLFFKKVAKEVQRAT